MMPKGLDRRPLQVRLAALRRRLRFLVTFRGLSWLVTVLLLSAALAGLLDWRVHLPGLVRAVVLVGTLAGAGYIAVRYLLQPLAARADDFALALRIEERYPFLNDCLASTVQFLERAARREPVDESQGSPTLRREAVQRTLRQIQVCDFHGVAHADGIGWAGLAMIGTLTLAGSLVYLHPALAWTALERLAVPFGSKDWPRQTRLEIEAAQRVARGEPFEMRGVLTGVIPDDAVIFYDGLTPARQVYTVRRDRDGSRGLLLARLERVEKSFRFQVQAHDALTPWHSVTVEPPPMLVPLDGRPSPQVHLRYPAYTDLPEHDLPDGSGNIDAVVGTHVTLRAAVDRPLARAWIEYRSEKPLLAHAAAAGALGGSSELGALALAAAAHEVTAPVPADLEANRQVFTVTFLPRVRGMYALRFEDDTGLSNLRLFDLHLLSDPAPTVNLERPSRAHDSLDVLPDADVFVQVSAEDPTFALRSIYLAYRCQKDDPPRNRPLYDGPALGGVLSQVSRSLMGSRFLLPPLGAPGRRTALQSRPDGSGEPSYEFNLLARILEDSLRFRPQHLTLRQRLSLQQFKHRDGRPLQEGDVLILQACADDFDDVSVDKQPGRSHEIELHIVSRAVLEQNLHQEQTKVQEELTRLRKTQQEALERVIGPEQRWRNTGKLRPQDGDQLLQAEQLQQQIRARVGNPEEGLRADVERILSTLRDNHLPRSGAHDRMETVASELDRLAREELEQIETRLTNARKENESASETKPPKGAKGQLGQARQHQEEVENTLGELLKLLEPWGNLNAVKGEARSILQEQRGLTEDVQKLDDETRGKEPDKLSPEQRAALGRAADLQRKLADRTGQLLDKMKRAGEERKDSDRPLADALREAAQKGEQGQVQEQMQDAAKNVQENNLGTAGRNQQAGIKALEAMVQALEERREQELDRLRKKLRETQDKLNDLTRRQEQLGKQMKDAAQIADPQKREQELKRLAREQEKLRQETQDMLKELTRLRADQASQALADAGNSMDQAGQRLQRGQDADEAQEETLERLNEARRRIEQSQAKVEEELAREKLAKIADQLRQLKERQESANAEAARIQQQVEALNKWPRSALINLRNLAEVQKTLGQETDGLAKGKLAEARVFTRILTRAADAMQQAAQHMLDRVEHPQNTQPDRDADRLQREAVRRLEQLLEAVKNDTGFGRAPANQGGEQGGQPGEQGQGSNVPSDGISFLAQLKALRSLQQEVNERTEDFNRKHPKPDQLKPVERQELEGLQKEQQDVADLLDELTTANQRGEKK